MFIEPNTNIRLLSGVPLNNTYNDTLWFDDDIKQVEYFKSKTKHNLTEQTYQRVNKGTARVGIKAEALYDCNYMMFQNTSFGNKWFFAFITSVEYVNNIVSEITFEIDVMQTWKFDYYFYECFVEREHSATDEAGDNLVVEQLDLGPIICNDIKSARMCESYNVVVARAKDTSSGGE